MMPSQIGSIPMASSTGPTMGTTTKVISMKSRMKPSRKITSITTRVAPTTPPGIASNSSVTSSSPPKARNTSEKSVAPIRIRNTMLVTWAVDCTTSRSTGRLRRRLTRASRKAPKAPTAEASVGAFGAFLLALVNRRLSLPVLREVVQSTAQVTSMVFLILIGATLFSLVFRAFGGEELVTELFEAMPGGVVGATLVVMLVIFLLGFILDFIEITFVVVPIVGPVLLAMGVDPIWLGIMIAVNLQTSFLTPPFGFALFYLRGVTPASVPTSAIYRGVIPFIAMQLCMLLALALMPGLATWLLSIM